MSLTVLQYFYNNKLRNVNCYWFTFESNIKYAFG